MSVRKVIAGMKPKLRMAILLKYFEDLSYDEMATAMGCSKGTVASRLNRAHRILARKLSHLRRGVGSGGIGCSETTSSGSFPRITIRKSVRPRS